METLTGLRSWGGVPVTQGSDLKQKYLGIRFLPGVSFLFKGSKMTNFNYDLFKVSKCVCFFMVKITMNFKISIHRKWLILLVN